MVPFQNLNTFYKNVNKDQDLPISEVGHFNIITIENLPLQKGKPVSYARRSYFKVSLVHGHSKIHYPESSTEIMASALVFTNPMIPYHWERVSEKQSGLICVFTDDFLSAFGNAPDFPVFKYADSGIILLKPKETVYFKRIFLRMSKELDSDYRFKYDLIRCLLMEVIHEAQKMQPDHRNLLIGSNAYERIALLFGELLERQFPIALSNQRIEMNAPQAFASQLNIHINHLNKALKEVTGKTTSELISNRIVQEAKFLLKSTTWSIKEIAWTMGFDEPNHFSAFFKRHNGCTPKQFRQIPND